MHRILFFLRVMEGQQQQQQQLQPAKAKTGRAKRIALAAELKVQIACKKAELQQLNAAAAAVDVHQPNN